MNRLVMISLFVFIGLISSIAVVMSATVTPVNQPITPPAFDSNQVILNKIDTEEKATRQFFSSELQRQNAYFISEFTKRADYYEQRYQEILNEAVLKLGMMWAGVFFIAVSFSSLLHYWSEKRRYGVMKKALKTDIVTEVKKEYVIIPDKEIKILNDYVVKKKEEEKGQKRGIFGRMFGKKRVAVVTKETAPDQPKQFASEQNNQATESFMDKIKRGSA